MLELVYRELQNTRKQIMKDCFRVWRAEASKFTQGSEHVASVVTRLCDQRDAELLRSTISTWRLNVKENVFIRTHAEHSENVRKWRQEHMSLLRTISELKAEMVMLKRTHEQDLNKLTEEKNNIEASLQEKLDSISSALRHQQSEGKEKDSHAKKLCEEIELWQERCLKTNLSVHRLAHPHYVLGPQ
eukprot:PhF_6_TR22561/c0_g1_i2/m.32097